MNILQDKGFLEFIWASVSKTIDQNHFEDFGRPAKALNSYPLIDFMRSSVRDGQVPTLLEHCDSEEDEIAGLAISLLARRCDETEVKERFMSIWRDPKSSYMKRWWVSFRLLDYPLGEHEQIHREVFEFVQGSWDRWLDLCTDYFGGGRELLYITIRPFLVFYVRFSCSHFHKALVRYRYRDSLSLSILSGFSDSE